METSNGSRPGTVSRGGQLRGVPTTVRRAAVRMLAISSRCGGSCGRRIRRGRCLGRGRRTVGRRPVLPSGSRGRGRRVDAPKAAGLQAIPRHGGRTGCRGLGRRRVRPPSPSSPHTAAARAARSPDVLRRRPPSGHHAADARPQSHSRTTGPIVPGFAQIDGGQPAGFGGRRRRRVRLAQRGRLSDDRGALAHCVPYNDHHRTAHVTFANIMVCRSLSCLKVQLQYIFTMR